MAHWSLSINRHICFILLKCLMTRGMLNWKCMRWKAEMEELLQHYGVTEIILFRREKWSYRNGNVSDTGNINYCQGWRGTSAAYNQERELERMYFMPDAAALSAVANSGWRMTQLEVKLIGNVKWNRTVWYFEMAKSKADFVHAKCSSDQYIIIEGANMISRCVIIRNMKISIYK